MTDPLGRNIDYLRLSVTDRCNLRCRYCMPPEGICKKAHAQMLTEDEMILAVEAAASLGITKVRITGGEPLVKKNILSICSRTGAVEGVREVCMTTNGVLLPRFARQLRQAGVSRLNISLDTLDPQKYTHITRMGALGDFFRGLDAAFEAGFEKIKLNAVLIGGFNDDEIPALAALTEKYPVDVRFIELMPMYDSGDFGETAFIPVTRVLEALPDAVPVAQDGGIARLYRLPEGKGNVGLISPVSAHFCAQCNRLRLTADGGLKPCLHSREEFSIKGLDFQAMRRVMETAIAQKPRWHGDLDARHRSHAGRNMHEIGG